MKLTLFDIFYFFFYRFSTQFTTILSKISTLRNEKKFNQENSKSANHVWRDAKKTHFFISNFIILQSTRSKKLLKNSTYSSYNLKQDPSLQSPSKNIKK